MEDDIHMSAWQYANTVHNKTRAIVVLIKRVKTLEKDRRLLRWLFLISIIAHLSTCIAHKL